VSCLCLRIAEEDGDGEKEDEEAEEAAAAMRMMLRWLRWWNRHQVVVVDVNVNVDVDVWRRRRRVVLSPPRRFYCFRVRLVNVLRTCTTVYVSRQVSSVKYVVVSQLLLTCYQVCSVRRSVSGMYQRISRVLFGRCSDSSMNLDFLYSIVLKRTTVRLYST
jgi:hypothetical protein